jgi:hypothetical protein
VITLDEKRVDWLYAHFQAISAAGNHYLVILALVVGFTFAAFLSGSESFTVPLLELTVARDAVMSASILIGGFFFVAYCGSYDMGEEILKRLCTVLHCEYEDLALVDTHPNPIDFARYVRPAAVQSRGFIARLLEALLYPSVLMLGLFWFTILAVLEMFFRPVRGAALVLYCFSLVILWFAWGRARPFFTRRWRAFLAAEQRRKLAAAEVSTCAAPRSST